MQLSELAGVEGGGHVPNAEEQQRIRRLFYESETLAAATDLAETQTKAARVVEHHREQDEEGVSADASTLESDLRNIEDTLVSDLNRRRFVIVSLAQHAFVNNDVLFGEDVTNAFPSASNDLREAGNCLAVECNTAAVFHLMRAVECGLRALGAHLGFKKIGKSKRGGKSNYVPVEYVQWEKIISQLQPELERRTQALKTGARKQRYQEVFYVAMQDIRAIKDAWRNHCMHARQSYSSSEAMTILNHVRSLLSRLAAEISER